MVKRSLFEIVQLITGIAVVAGLVLVVLQLQQTQDIARKQQQNAMRLNYDMLTMSIVGEDLSASIARACEQPQQLTGADLVALNAYFLELLVFVLYAYREEGTEFNSNRPWRIYADGSFDAMFLTAAGKAWWKRQAGLDWMEIPQEVVDLGNEYLRSAPTTCYLDGWREEMMKIR